MTRTRRERPRLRWCWLPIGAWLLAAQGCAAIDDDAGAPAGDDFGLVRAAVTQVPEDVFCVEIDASSAQIEPFDVTPGEPTTFLLRLPPRSATLTARAYDTSCDQIADLPPNWASNPVTVAVVAGRTLDVTLTLYRLGDTEVTVDFAPYFVGVAAGRNNGYAWTDDGFVYSWGAAAALGDGGEARTVPMQIPDLTNVVEVAAGEDFACARHEDGGLSCWGDDTVGQLGNGDIDGDSPTPNPVALLPPLAVDLTAGGQYACAILEDGSGWCWGHAVGMGDGRNFGFFPHEHDAVAISTTEDLWQIDAGTTHTCAVTYNGQVLCWGVGNNWQLGRSTEVNSATPAIVDQIDAVAQVNLGGDHTTVTRFDGSVWVFGDNEFAELHATLASFVFRTLSTRWRGAVDMDCGFRTCCAAFAASVGCRGGSVALLGNGGATVSLSGISSVPLSGVTGISMASHVLAVRNDGTVWAWGFNTEGQLGVGDRITRFVPTRIAVDAPPADGGGGEP